MRKLFPIYENKRNNFFHHFCKLRFELLPLTSSTCHQFLPPPPLMADSCYTRQIAAPSCRHRTRHTAKSNVCNVETCTFYTDKWSTNAWNFFYFPSKFPLTSSETNATQTLQFWRPMAISWYSPYWKKKWIEFQIQIYRSIPKTILSLSLSPKKPSKRPIAHPRNSFNH